VHFSEPHDPYDEHAGFGVERPSAADRSKGWQKRWRYASEVAYTDHMIGALLESVTRHLPAEDTIVVFVADHGESLGEHSYWGHGKNTLWPNLAIPLVMAGPGIPAGRRIDGPASIIDVLPTLTELLSLTPPAQVEGVSLVGSWSAEQSDERRRFTFADRHTAIGQDALETFEHPLEISLVTRGVKTIYDFAARRARFFDLHKDPEELLPLESPPVSATPPLYRQLAGWYQELSKYQGSESKLSDEDLAQLKSLGYVGSP
jgi:choline-sulfatase